MQEEDQEMRKCVIKLQHALGALITNIFEPNELSFKFVLAILSKSDNGDEFAAIIESRECRSIDSV